jgi:hypothetical protein
MTAAALKFLGWRGIVGLVGMLALSVLLVVQKGETRHWKKQSGQFEQLYRGEVTAHQKTIGNYRVAAEQARKDDAANAARVLADQRAINERTSHDFEARLADARARAAAQRLRSGTAAANSGGGRTAPVPGVPAPAGRSAQAAGEGGLPAEDALTATEQAIQLDELIKWVKKQSAVDVNGH